MLNRISGIIIDKHQDTHDYSQITYWEKNDKVEQGFDITLLKDSQDILKTLNDKRGIDSIITIGNDLDFTPLKNLPFEYRKRWLHMDEFNADDIVYYLVNIPLNNLNRINGNEDKLFSIFTSMYNTPQEYFDRLYNSLLKQTYTNWNWYIIDDSDNNKVRKMIHKIKDPRIIMFKNETNHGNIGFNKHAIAMLCNGDYLVEVDHDDELTEDCLEMLLKCYNVSDADFVYSDCLEEIDGNEIWYGEPYTFGLNQGIYRDEEVQGRMRHIAVCTPNINCKSIRCIYAEPNHVRTWKKEFYHKIGGHNIELSVLDDMDLMIRTFLHGKMAKVNKVLYIQHEGTSQGNGRGGTAQGHRFKEIQRLNWMLKWKYDTDIHNRILELGYEDLVWNEEKQESDVNNEMHDLEGMDYIYKPE